MDRDEFVTQLEQEGFKEVVTVTREAGGTLDVHSHPFESKALVLDGEIELQVGGASRLFVAGDVFHLQTNEPHAERYGASGVRFLVGRK
jgi:quercetin dioxygenase-like cupin family protein